MNDTLWDAVQEVDYEVVESLAGRSAFVCRVMSGPLTNSEITIRDINISDEGLLTCDYDLLELEDADCEALRQTVAGILKKIFQSSIKYAEENQRLHQD